ncbi:MAG: transporter, family, tetracycline resistance protein [Gaiellaceae bacterium]|nr:transporter, family, tetracycline resistance protein [Gaiellaceae bacterium]
MSAIGDAAFFTALGWRAFTLVGSSRLGIVFVCQGIGLLATLLIGGALADRLPRRLMMIASDLARFLVVGAIAAADATGHLSFSLLIALAFLAGLGDGFFFPAFGGIVPLVVTAEALPSANSLIGVSRWGSILIGPSLAALLYGGVGSSTVFALNAGSFIVSAGLLWLARPRQITTEPKESALKDIADGFRYVARYPWLWVTISLFAVILMLQLAPQQVLLPALVRDHFGRGVTAYGLLTTMFGGGTVLGALAFGQLHPRRRRGLLNYTFWLLNSLAIAALAVSPTFELALAFAFLRGLCVGFGVAMWETMLQELVPEHMLSRVVSLDFFGSFGLMPIGLAFAAGVATLASPGTIIATGALISATLIAFTMTRPWLRAVE